MANKKAWEPRFKRVLPKLSFFNFCYRSFPLNRCIH
nr:MAG TPA: hypothetical protein [Caudoviricetes sp.]